MRKLAQIIRREGRADQILVFPRKRVDEVLLLILNQGLKAERLLRLLDNRIADAAAVNLLQFKALREVVVKGHCAEVVEPVAEVLVALKVGVINGRLDSGF